MILNKNYSTFDVQRAPSRCWSFCKGCLLLPGIPAAIFNAYLVFAAHPSSSEIEATHHMLGGADCAGMHRVFGDAVHGDASESQHVRPLFIVRHVQSEANVNGLAHVFNIDPKATNPKGHEQAMTSGEVFKQWLLDRCGIDIDPIPVKAHISVSQLQRTHETAAILASTMGLGQLMKEKLGFVPLAGFSLAACSDENVSKFVDGSCYLHASVDPRLNEMSAGFDNTWSSSSRPCADVDSAVAHQLCHDTGLDLSVSDPDPWWSKWWHQAMHGNTNVDFESLLQSHFDTEVGILPIIVTHETFLRHLAAWLAKHQIDTSTSKGKQLAANLTALRKMRLGNAMILKLDIVPKQTDKDSLGFVTALGVVAPGGAASWVDFLQKPAVWCITLWGFVGLAYLLRLWQTCKKRPA